MGIINMQLVTYSVCTGLLVPLVTDSVEYGYNMQLVMDSICTSLLVYLVTDSVEYGYNI